MGTPGKDTRCARSAPFYNRFFNYRLGDFVRHEGELYLATRDIPPHTRPVKGARHWWRHVTREDLARSDAKSLTRFPRRR